MLCLCFVFSRFVHIMMPVPLDCPILLDPSVFTNLHAVNMLKSMSRGFVSCSSLNINKILYFCQNKNVDIKFSAHDAFLE
jgi:hypothetical protein